MCINCWSGFKARTTRFKKGMRKAMKVLRAERDKRVKAMCGEPQWWQKYERKQHANR